MIFCPAGSGSAPGRLRVGSGSVFSGRVSNSNMHSEDMIRYHLYYLWRFLCSENCFEQYFLKITFSKWKNFWKKLKKMKNFENLFFCKILSNFYNKFAKKSINLNKNSRSRRQVVQRMLRHFSFKRTFSNVGPAEHRPRLGSGSAGRLVTRRPIGCCWRMNSWMQLADGFFLP